MKFAVMFEMSPESCGAQRGEIFGILPKLGPLKQNCRIRKYLQNSGRAPGLLVTYFCMLMLMLTAC